MINSDSMFWIGTSHKVCEDYALSYNLDGFSYAIVCDGCSSSPETDFGARLLAKAAEYHIKRIEEPDYGLYVIEEARLNRNAIGLHDLALDATLLVAASFPDKTIIKVFGDGVVLVDGCNETEVFGSSGILRCFEYQSNAPYYLNYKMDKVRSGIYVDNTPKHDKIITYYDYPKMLSNYTEEFDATADHTYIYNRSNRPQLFLLMSDGICSFIDKESKGSVPLEDIIDELLNFKLFNGKFIERRVQKFRKLCVDNNWQNFDDVSIAGIYIQ